jgi:hypothetical protein
MENERAAEHKLVKTSKHFISVSNSDSNDFGTAAHNPANMRISFNNPTFTNVQSFSDQTTTHLNVLNMTLDLHYNNVSESYRNNRFRIRSASGTALFQGAAENYNAGLPAGSAPVYPTFRIADGIYKTGDDLVAAIKAAITAAPVSWNNAGAAGNALNFAATVAQPSPLGNILLKYTGLAPNAGTPLIFIDTIFTHNGAQYDSSRLFGTTNDTITFTHAGGAAVFIPGAFQLPFATVQGAAAAGAATPAFIDLQTIQTFRMHSNISKRGFSKAGDLALAPALRPLTQNDILFEFSSGLAQIGQTLYWEPTDSRWEQIVNSNFDELTLYITDKNNNQVALTNNSEVSISFTITREINVVSNEARVKSLMNYNQFRTM